ncbi:MAG: hypothetical protein PHY02_09550 [Phycisphaerae bacterium]|nr:hypothetical protein [Phycisphaerae bacterium]
MKKTILITVLSLCSQAFAVLSTVPHDAGLGQHLTTVQHKAELVVTAEANMAELDPNDEMTWDDCKTLATHIPTKWNAVSLSFYGYGDGGDTRGVADSNDPGDPCNATFKFSVYFCDFYGGLEPALVDANGVIGDQQLSHDPAGGTELNAGEPNSSYCWADTINSGTASWGKTITYSNYLGTNMKAELKIDRQESYGIYVRIYNISSGVAKIYCVMNGF